MSVLALEMRRSAARYVAARTVGAAVPGTLTGALAPLKLVQREEPRPLGPGWGRVEPRLAGICGSDLATIAGRASFYFSPLVSMPFVPGHEVVGTLLDDLPGDDGDGALPAGTRVVLDPLLTCVTRGLAPCRWCVEGRTSRCERVTVGHVAPGLQTGYCTDTGGGWSRLLVAHRAQLHRVPDGLPDERAVLVEPLSCAVHASLRARITEGDTVLVVGAGSVGLLTLLAIRAYTPAGQVVVVAKHRRQADLAERFGATTVVSPGSAIGAVRRMTRALRLDPERGQPYLLGGVDVAVDCVGSTSSLDAALRSVRAGGRVVLAGMPDAEADLSPVWFRELEVAGAYATGTETLDGVRRHAFDLAIDLAGDAPLDGAVEAAYPLHRWREALDHAFSAGALGTVKVAFDLTEGS